MGTLKDMSDKASDYLDKKGLANPVEVVNEALGGESREESKKRREAAKEKVVKETPQPIKKMAKGGGVAPTKMGAVKTAAPSRDGVATKGKTKGTQIKMKAGGYCGGGMAKKK